MDDQARRFLESVVPEDFDVALLGSNDSGCLYAGRRKHTLAVIHGQIQTEGDRASISIWQRHIPRFLLAEALAGRAVEADEVDEGVARPVVCEGVALIGRAEGGANLEFFPLSEGIPASLYQADVDSYRRAVGKVKQDGDCYVLPRSKSHTGKPVASRSKRLIEAIAFERETVGRLDARKFGPYSAFCTWKDFCEGQTRSLGFYREHIEGQLAYNAETGSFGDFMALALRVQDALLSKRIWGRGVRVSPEEATEVLRDGMETLDSFQFAQFTLLNGMHGAGLFLPLAQVLGLNSWETYVEWMSQGVPPDSEEEQRLREETAVIELLGRLGSLRE